MPAENESELREYWESVRLGGPLPEPVEQRYAREHPGDLVIGTSKERMLVRIHPDGTLTYGPNYTPDEAAVTFWTAMAQRRLETELRLIQFQTQENLLQRVAEADIAYETSQLRARREEATEHDRFMEEMSRRNLETRVHVLLEFARGLVRREPTPSVVGIRPSPQTDPLQTNPSDPSTDDPAP
jgi:hypothetical protein